MDEQQGEEQSAFAAGCNGCVGGGCGCSALLFVVSVLSLLDSKGSDAEGLGFSLVAAAVVGGFAGFVRSFFKRR